MKIWRKNYAISYKTFNKLLHIQNFKLVLCFLENEKNISFKKKK